MVDFAAGRHSFASLCIGTWILNTCFTVAAAYIPAVRVRFRAFPRVRTLRLVLKLRFSKDGLV